MDVSTPVKDPVCGMSVDPAHAKATAEHQGRTYYFCCPGCAQKFTAEPQKYLQTPGLVSLELRLAKPAGLVSIGAETCAVGSTERDPVCGMMVDPAHAAVKPRPGQATTSAIRSEQRFAPSRKNSGLQRRRPSTVSRNLHLPHGSGGAPGRSGRVPQVRHGAGTGNDFRARDQDRMGVPDAPGDRARRAGRVPDLRHGAGAAHRHRGRAGESRTARHDAPLLGQPGAHRPAARDRHGPHGAGAGSTRFRAGC